MYKSAGDFVKTCVPGRDSTINTRSRLAVSNDGNLGTYSIIHILCAGFLLVGLENI